MKVVFRNELPGKSPRETRLEGWLAVVIAVVVGLAIVALLVFVVIPLALVGIATFIAVILLAAIVGWIWLGFKIGFGNLWDLTRLVLGIGFGPSRGESRGERIKRAWEERVKGRSGEWTK